MIDAKEAKRLYDESGAEVNNFIKTHVEQKIIDASKSGKRHVHIHIGTVKVYETVNQVTTPFYRAVVSKLLELGFTAKIELDGDRYVPRALADDDGNGPSHQNYGINIGW